MDTFLKQKLFYANPVGLYCSMERGQGDRKEASIIDKPLQKVYNDIQVMDIENGEYFPVFCCYAVTENDVENGSIINIDKRCVMDFLKKKDAKMVVVSYENMMEATESCKYAVKKQMVKYHDGITLDDTIMYSRFPLEAIYHKNEYFSYQNEYRITFDDRIEGVIKQKNNGFIIDYTGLGKGYTYKKEIKPVGIYNINQLEFSDDGSYLLKLL